MYKVEIKKIDSHGRLSLPVEWRRALKRREVVVIELDDRVEVLSRDADLAKYIDSAEVDVKNFEDYHKLRRDLRKLK